MQPLRLNNLSTDDLTELHTLYESTRDVRLRTRAQMILLAAEKQMTAPQIADIVRRDRQTVRRWLKRYKSEGVEGLRDAPRAGAPGKVTEAYQKRLYEVVKQHPHSLGQPHTEWTLNRLAAFMEEETGISVSYETVRLYLRDAGIALGNIRYSSPNGSASKNGKH